MFLCIESVCDRWLGDRAISALSKVATIQISESRRDVFEMKTVHIAKEISVDEAELKYST